MKFYISLKNLNIMAFVVFLFISVFLVSACSVSDTGIEDDSAVEEIEVVTDNVD